MANSTTNAIAEALAFIAVSPNFTENFCEYESIREYAEQIIASQSLYSDDPDIPVRDLMMAVCVGMVIERKQLLKREHKQFGGMG